MDTENINIHDSNIVKKYYLCTRCNYEKPICILRPVGSFKELDSYDNKSEIFAIKSLYTPIDNQRQTSGQYGT